MPFLAHKNQNFFRSVTESFWLLAAGLWQLLLFAYCLLPIAHLFSYSTHALRDCHSTFRTLTIRPLLMASSQQLIFLTNIIHKLRKYV